MAKDSGRLHVIKILRGYNKDLGEVVFRSWSKGIPFKCGGLPISAKYRSLIEENQPTAHDPSLVRPPAPRGTWAPSRVRAVLFVSVPKEPKPEPVPLPPIVSTDIPVVVPVSAPPISHRAIEQLVLPADDPPPPPKKKRRKKRSGYVVDWAEISKSIRRRDGVCQRCGSPDRLSVHHIDTDKTNNDPGNLITYCWPCHRRVHWEIARERRARRDIELSFKTRRLGEIT